MFLLRISQSRIRFRCSGPNLSMSMNIHDSGVQLKYIRDRMLHSALNFAIGFFGLPIEGKYLQSVTIEEDGVCLTNHVFGVL